MPGAASETGTTSETQSASTAASNPGVQVQPSTSGARDQTSDGTAENGSSGPGAWERRYQLINTISTAAAAFMAAAALVLSVMAYMDSRSSSKDEEQKEASKVNWYFLDVGGETERLVIENRGLLPVYDTFLNIENEEADNLQRFEVGEMSPCSRAVFKFGDKGKLVRSDQYSELFFRDSMGGSWRMGYAGVLSDLGEINVKRGTELDYVREWKLNVEYVDLDACG